MTREIEQMARAMHADGYTSDMSSIPKFAQDELRSQARAALHALAENISDEMVRAAITAASVVRVSDEEEMRAALVAALQKAGG